VRARQRESFYIFVTISVHSKPSLRFEAIAGEGLPETYPQPSASLSVQLQRAQLSSRALFFWLNSF
jgi:hypothetical protein